MVREWILFTSLSVIAVAGAYGMVTTMSMFRAGIFLMASFLGLAGFSLMLAAPLIAVMQIMMYGVGMLVMILFMILMSNDPGGAMMWPMMGMKPGRLLDWFTSKPAEKKEDQMTYTCPMHPEVRQSEPGACPKCQMPLQPADQMGHEAGTDQASLSGDMSGMSDMSDMMMTHHTKEAALVGVLSAAALLLLISLYDWQPVLQTPDPDPAMQVGVALLSRYMIAFEGAALVILLGMVGAILLSRNDSIKMISNSKQEKSA